MILSGLPTDIAGSTSLLVGGAAIARPAAPAYDSLSIGTPAIAFSVRKVRSAFAGSCMRVRRSIDDTEQDIGFTGSGDLDQVALLAFVGANNGFVSKWYDQSGNARDAIQATLASQPRIVSAGVVDVVNTKPSIFFSGSTYLLVTGFTYGGPKTLASVIKATVNVSGIITVIRQGAGSGAEWAFRCAQNTIAPYFYSLSGGYKQTGPTSDTTVLGSWIFANLATATIFKDGASDSTQTTYSFNASTNGNIGIGGNDLGAEKFTGSISEIGCFNSAAGTSDQASINASVKTYYGTP